MAKIKGNPIETYRTWGERYLLANEFDPNSGNAWFDSYIDNCKQIVLTISSILYQDLLCGHTYFDNKQERRNFMHVEVEVDDESEPRYEECRPDSEDEYLRSLILGKYRSADRTIVFYQKNIENVAMRKKSPGFNLSTLTIAVAAHEMMHALFHPVGVDKIYDPYFEEPLCEAGMLYFIKKHVKGNDDMYPEMKSWVDGKFNCRGLAHYGFGAYLHEKCSNLKYEKEWLTIMLFSLDYSGYGVLKNVLPSITAEYDQCFSVYPASRTDAMKEMKALYAELRRQFYSPALNEKNDAYRMLRKGDVPNAFD